MPLRSNCFIIQYFSEVMSKFTRGCYVHCIFLLCFIYLFIYIFILLTFVKYLLEYLPLIFISIGTILMMQGKHHWNLFVYICLGIFWKTIRFNNFHTYAFVTLKFSQIYPLFSFQYDFYCLKHNNEAIKKNRFW